MKALEVLVTSLLTVIVLVLATQLTGIESATQVSQYYQASTIPTIFIVVTILVLAATLIQSTIGKRGDDERSFSAVLGDVTRKRRVALMAASFLYVLVFDYLGFVVSSFVFLLVTSCLLSVDFRREWLVGAAIACVTTGLVYAIVVYGLKSYLPVYSGPGA